MIRGKRTTWLVATAALGLAYAGPAYAQATRTWVSGTGDDANPCSRTAPCKTMAGAISKTAAGGEINCIDPGGFGALTITKSITIDCKNVEAGILVSGTNGFVVAAGANDVVVIRGLDFEGLGPTVLSLNGIKVLTAAAVHVEDCVIRGFASSNGTDGNGIFLNPSAATKLYVERTMITGNGGGTGGGGILIKPSVAGASAKVELKDVHALNDNGYGMKVDGTVSTAGTTVNADNIELSGNATVGVNATAGGTNPIAIMLANSVVSNNTTTGIVTIGTGVTVRVGNTTITGNATGVNAASGAINSYGDNRLDGNATNGTFTGTVLPKH